MNAYNFILVFTSAMFVMIFFNADAIANCKVSGNLSIGIGQCGGKISRLKTLFKRNNAELSGSKVFSKIYERQMHVPFPTKSPVREKIRIRKTAVSNSIVFNPIQKPVVNTKSTEIISNSTNKSLSEFGPDAAAEFIVRCRDNQLNVLFNFPGYPMNDKEHINALSYQVDRAQAWTAQFQPASEFSAIGIWENSNAYIFLSSIMKGHNLHINTKDMEETKITADFNIPDIISKLEKMNGDCHLPS